MNTQDKAEASCNIPKAKKCLKTKWLESCQRDTGVNLKALPITKAGEIWTIKSIM